MKKILVSMVVLLISACSNDQTYHFASGSDDTGYWSDISACPKVHIRNKDFRVVQSEAGMPLFEIQASGYDGYCYEENGRTKARIEPKFKITRLTTSDVDVVHFSYYLETVKGPSKYLGKKTYFAEVELAPLDKVTTYKAKASELTIPPHGNYDIDVYMGLNVSKADMETKN